MIKVVLTNWIEKFFYNQGVARFVDLTNVRVVLFIFVYVANFIKFNETTVKDVTLGLLRKVPILYNLKKKLCWTSGIIYYTFVITIYFYLFFRPLIMYLYFAIVMIRAMKFNVLLKVGSIYTIWV